MERRKRRNSGGEADGLVGANSTVSSKNYSQSQTEGQGRSQSNNNTSFPKFMSPIKPGGKNAPWSQIQAPKDQVSLEQAAAIQDETIGHARVKNNFIFLSDQWNVKYRFDPGKTKLRELFPDAQLFDDGNRLEIRGILTLPGALESGYLLLFVDGRKYRIVNESTGNDEDETKMKKLLEEMRSEQKQIAESITSLKKTSLMMAKEATQKKLYQLDVWAPSKRNRDDQKAFKDSLIKFYQRAAGGGNIRCQLVDKPFAATMVRASHIWKASTHGRGLEEFDLAPVDVNSPRNGMLLCVDIEQAFDAKQLCFLYNHSRECLYCRVLDPSILNYVIRPTPSTTFEDIDGAVLRHPHGVFPFRRILNWHARLCFEHAKSMLWIDASEVVEDYFSTSGITSLPGEDESTLLNMLDDQGSYFGAETASTALSSP